MQNEVDVKNDSLPDSDDTDNLVAKSSGLLDSLKKFKKQFSYLLFVVAFVLIVTGVQALIFYNKYTPQIEANNEQLFSLMIEKTRREGLLNLQDQFRSIMTALKGQPDISSRFEATFEIMVEHFREGPLGTMEQVQSEFEIILGMIREKLEQEPVDVLSEASTAISGLSADMTGLQDIYTIPFDELHSQLQSPPWYLMPTAGYLRDTSGYLNSVTFNRAIYLAQIGEIGTSRVLLSGMYASAEDETMLGLVYYGLGRLQWELFLTRLEPENYFQAVNYVRQSLQTNPGASLSKRLFDYMLSLTEAESTPGAGRGDPTTLTEGEAGAVQSPDPLF